jgi:methylase of polypeptide subunit release factors
LEFDLESILEGNRFNEFALFYRVCHRTRMPRTAEDATSCWLEKYFQLSIEQGGRVRDKLRDGVEDALKSLGTGFLRHPDNVALRDRVKKGTLTAAEFHRQLLRLVYRLLFLMVAEERRMIVPEGLEADRRQSLYDRYYSVGRLRALAEKPIEASTFGDLWIGLQQTFYLFEDGDSNPLGIPPLNGDLFSAIAVRDLQGTHLYNDVLLAAMQRLSLFEDHRVRQRVNYSALDVEELGSVYESLLDFQPAFAEQTDGMIFELRTGSERKSTGSYYTRPELVRELIESALVPVIQDRLARAKDSDPAKEREKKQQAILSMSVCDPACGSGHFLLAAARRLGRELAKVRTGEDEPIPKEFHLAVRDVIAHCVYGVDVNPLAVDLCKLALWLEGHWTGKPLSFLDHRIKLGNSLIGVLNMDVLEGSILDEAFNPVTGDDKKVANSFKKRNRDEREGQPSLPFDVAQHVHQFATESEDFVSIAENTPADVRRKKEAYEKARQKPDWWHDWVAANLWTAAFFLPLTKHDDPALPTHNKFMAYLRGKHVDAQMEGSAIGIATELHFFHWQLDFPEIFERGGFDVLLGNPPWDRIKLQEEEFFSTRDDRLAKAPTKAARKALIANLPTTNPILAQAFEAAKHEAESTSKFVRFSGRFPLTAVGDVNTYALFAELARELLCQGGAVGHHRAYGNSHR